MAGSPFGDAFSTELIDRADETLRRVARAEAFHAHAVAEALGALHDGGGMSLRALDGRPEPREPKRALLVALIRERRDALQRDAADECAPRDVPRDGGPLTVLGLLRHDRRRVERSCEGLRDALARLALREAESPALDRLIANGFYALAGQLSTLLELRALAAGFTDPIAAGFLDRERANWDRTARLIARMSFGRTMARAVHQRAIARREPEREGPLASRVILIVSRESHALAVLTALTEGLGATTILAESRLSALELLRWFQVDAVFCEIEHGADPRLDLPSAYVGTDDAQRPLFLAFPAGVTDIGEEHGFDATVSLAGTEADSFGAMLARALSVRDVEPLRR